MKAKIDKIEKFLSAERIHQLKSCSFEKTNKKIFMSLIMAKNKICTRRNSHD